MKEVIVKIPNNKYDFFMELVRQLGIDVTEELEIPKEHIDIVRERVQTTKPEGIIPWSEARKKLIFKDK